MALLLSSLLPPCLHVSELVVRRPMLRTRSHAACSGNGERGNGERGNKLDVETANAFGCMGYNIGRQACNCHATPCSLTLATPHPDPPQLGELTALDEEEIDALLAGIKLNLMDEDPPGPLSIGCHYVLKARPLWPGQCRPSG